MYERLLLIAADPAWVESLVIATDGDHCETRQAETVWRDIVAFEPTIVVVNVDCPGLSVAPDDRVVYARDLVGSVLKQSEAASVVLVSSVPADRLQALSDSSRVEVLLDREANASSLKEGIFSAAERIRSRSRTLDLEKWASIEITLGTGIMECEAQFAGHTKRFMPVGWHKGELALLDSEFRHVEMDSDLFSKKVDFHFLETVSKRLLWHIFEAPISQSLAYFKTFLEWDVCERVYYRFTVFDGELEFVPLELVGTGNDGEYLRSVSPVARRIVVQQQHKSSRRRPDDGHREKLVKVLFIMSEVDGSLQIPFHRFKSRDVISLSPLPHIRQEFSQVLSLYGRRNVRLLRMRKGRDNLRRLLTTLSTKRFDVVHFAGHSVRADDSGKVFLAFPGRKARTIDALNVDDFARRVAGTGARLVVLSSCEGASCRALSRLAAFGIPAVAGFRWRVDDHDAAIFTPALHRALCGGQRGIPVVRAFQEALFAVKEPARERLSWLSPVLMLQPKSWHHYRVEDES